METIKFKQRLTESDYSDLLVFTVFEKKKFNKIFLLFITPALGILFLLFFLIIEEADAFSIGISIFLIVFGPFFRFFYASIGKKTYRKSPLLQVESEIVFLEDKIEAFSERGSSKYFFSEVTSVYETKKFFILYIGMAHFIGINKQSVGETLSLQIQSILKSQMKKLYIDRT
ncbi:MAG: YcxB family protein [Tenericutes bacterium]|nr:YcxB family protein [Mycoplasmatota bacterium]